MTNTIDIRRHFMESAEALAESGEKTATNCLVSCSLDRSTGLQRIRVGIDELANRHCVGGSR